MPGAETLSILLDGDLAACDGPTRRDGVPDFEDGRAARDGYLAVREPGRQVSGRDRVLGVMSTVRPTHFR